MADLKALPLTPKRPCNDRGPRLFFKASPAGPRYWYCARCGVMRGPDYMISKGPFAATPQEPHE